jgi:hypothetical protein
MWRRAIGVSLTLWICAGNSLSQTAPAGIRFTSGPSSGNFTHHRVARTFNAGFPFWPDYLPSNETAPSVIVIQAPAAPVERPAAKPDEPKSAAPLLIEWQGDRYVRRTSVDANSRASQPDYIADTKQAAPARAPVANHPAQKSGTPPTIFIFRDGHHDESNDYSIISGIIYARLDYWTAGQWSRQIHLTDLDVPATIKANQDQGTPFRVPRAPNEIITRP